MTAEEVLVGLIIVLFSVLLGFFLATELIADWARKEIR